MTSFYLVFAYTIWKESITDVNMWAELNIYVVNTKYTNNNIPPPHYKILCTHQQDMIGRRPWSIPSHSLLYTLPHVPRLTRYQRRQCILSQREYVLNRINGNLGQLEYPIWIFVSDRPHLVYEASLEDLIEPTKEVVIAFMYIAKNGNKVFCSCTLPHGVFKWTHSQQSQVDRILEGGVPQKSFTSMTVTVNKIVVCGCHPILLLQHLHRPVRQSCSNGLLLWAQILVIKLNKLKICSKIRTQ